MTLARHMLTTALAFAMLGGAATAHAETLVIKATGPSARDYPPGRKLADNASLVLRAGDSITVLDPRGTRTVRGPGTFSAGGSATGAAAADNSATTRLASLLTTPRMRRARTGAVRGSVEEATAPRSPNLWYVDTTRSGGICVTDPAAVRLWRPDISQADTLTATAVSGDASGPIGFAQGVMTAAWPMDALPITDGAAYRLSGGSLQAPVEIRFSLVTLPDQNAATIASALLANSCNAQLELLAEATAVPDAPAG